MNGPVVLVAGLRGDVEDHWQSHLARTLPDVVVVDSFGRDQADLDGRIADLEAAVAGLTEPATIVAHSAGVLVTVHWAARTARTAMIRGAVLATPPDLGRPLPAAYPTSMELARAGWLPVPAQPLPFPSVVGVSADDDLGDPVRVRALARAWGSAVEELGAVGHLNPASGFGPWPGALDLLATLDELVVAR
ncbi:MAG TPA: alpha/beta hydrolase [Nocardioides sp.]|nr:alpha/beta hydrolase [Nocardioides sp.]